MDIMFKTDALRKEFGDPKLLRKRHGKRQAELIERRLAQLYYAAALEDMRSQPGRCHALKGDRHGQLSLDLVHPQRLILEPADDPLPTLPDGGLDWKRVTAVMITGIEDTHE